MTNVIKLKKGLDIRLQGLPARKRIAAQADGDFALLPDEFVGVAPKVVVREGDRVQAGDALFVNKKFPEVCFVSPVSGTVTAVIRGDRRKLLCVKVAPDKSQSCRPFQVGKPESMKAEAVKDVLLEAGLFGMIRQLPYAVSADPSCQPKAVFVSAFRDMPLSADFDVELEGNEEAFQTGLSALARVAKTYLGISPRQQEGPLAKMKDVEVNVFDGPCPAANPSVQANHLDPVNKGETVWMVDPMVVVFIGRLFATGKVDFRRTIALAGSEFKDPAYVDVTVGQPLQKLIESQLSHTDHVRLIMGNPLIGRQLQGEAYAGVAASEVTAIPEGDDRDEMLGWIMPRTQEFSANRSYFSWLFGRNKAYRLDARVKGGERKMIMSGEYDSVLPMDIYGEYLVKAIIAGDIDKMEQLGIYEVAPEDFAVAEFVDSSKLELQSIVRQGLDMLRKENA